VNSDDLRFTSAVELSSLVRDKQISPATPATRTPSSSMEKACPSGCKYVGNGFAGVTLLQAATAFDAAYPWAQHRPPEAA